MKLKYYLRGMGIGIILTALVMGFALGGRKSSLSDAEVIERAKALGMVEGTQGVLSDYSGEEISNDETTAAFTSDSSLDEAGKEVSKEVDQEVALSDKPVQEVAGEKKEREDTTTEDANAASKATTTSEEVADNSTANTSKDTADANESTAQSNSASDSKTATTADNSSAQNTASYTTSKTITVTIPGGLGSDAVAQLLYNEGVVDSAYSFNRYLIDRRKDRVIRSGTKVIPAGSSYEDIANIICQ
ncbi:hypothetical protein [Butyrivibrio proteoclasticus]|uniref:hypothetical protein n=1 Tax=Butyrivibrio proteoclasticus TaxID=43305 RepID=UPI00047B61F9|nr:hypothetical protein [Butyrivibrio proteoclasticus]